MVHMVQIFTIVRIKSKIENSSFLFPLGSQNASLAVKQWLLNILVTMETSNDEIITAFQKPVFLYLQWNVSLVAVYSYVYTLWTTFLRQTLK